MLRLDLHTHLYEATRCDVPNQEMLDLVLDYGRQQNLDGLAITEHWDWEFGGKLVRLKEDLYPRDQFLLIPGREVEVGRTHIVETLLPGNWLLRFLAHPGYLGAAQDNWQAALGDVAGIELANSMHTVIEQRASQIAREKGLIVLRNSDAHYLADIGLYSSELLWDGDEGRWWGYDADRQLIPISHKTQAGLSGPGCRQGRII